MNYGMIISEDELERIKIQRKKEAMARYIEATSESIEYSELRIANQIQQKQNSGDRAELRQRRMIFEEIKAAYNSDNSIKSLEELREKYRLEFTDINGNVSPEYQFYEAQLDSMIAIANEILKEL